MDTKVCTRCGEDLPVASFYRLKANPSGFQTQCKECLRVSRGIKRKKDPMRNDKLLKEAKRVREYRKTNKANENLRRRSSNNGPAIFTKYRKEQLLGESVRENEQHHIQVKCKNSACLCWFTPTNGAIRQRIDSIQGRLSGNTQNNLYCSDYCKSTCFIYRAKAKNFIIIDGNGEHINHSMFYSSSNLIEWATQVKQNANHTCEICGSKESLQAHHIQPKATHPEIALDPSNGACLCHKCHMEHGHSGECSTGKIRRCSVK